jgi:hypothetical protein
MKRRDVLCGTLALLASPALAQRASNTAITDYERDSGGHIGLYVHTGLRRKYAGFALQYPVVGYSLG